MNDIFIRLFVDDQNKKKSLKQTNKSRNLWETLQIGGKYSQIKETENIEI